MEPLPLGAVRLGAAEVRVRQVCPPGPANHGEAVGRPEAPPTPDADRRRRPPCQVVLPVEGSSTRGEAHWRGTEAPDGCPRHAEVEELASRSSVSGHAFRRAACPSRETGFCCCTRTLYRLLFDQPVQCFLPGLERGQITLRKDFHVLVEYLGQGLRSHPCGALDVRPVENQPRLDNLHDPPVKSASSRTEPRGSAVT